MPVGIAPGTAAATRVELCRGAVEAPFSSGLGVGCITDVEGTFGVVVVCAYAAPARLKAANTLKPQVVFIVHTSSIRHCTQRGYCRLSALADIE